MAISVKDIKEKDFSSQKHGYSIEEVDDFLDEIADQVSELIRENLALKNSLQQAQNAPAPEPVVIEKETAKPEFDDQGYFRNLENAMRESLINAQRIAEETRQAAEKEKREKELERLQAAAQVLEQQEPARKSRRRRKKKPAGEETAPVEQSLERKEPVEDYLPQRPKLTRPGTLMDTGDAMPNTEFTRPNPFDSDVIMDATARLLAPRRSVYSSGEPARSNRGEHSRKKKSGEGQSKQRQEAPAQEHKQSQGKKRRGGKKPQQAAPEQERRERTEAAQGGQHKGEPRQKRRGHQRSGPGRGPVEPFHSGQTKDSTEQASLIKPFYINVGR